MNDINESKNKCPPMEHHFFSVYTNSHTKQKIGEKSHFTETY